MGIKKSSLGGFISDLKKDAVNAAKSQLRYEVTKTVRNTVHNTVNNLKPKKK